MRWLFLFGLVGTIVVGLCCVCWLLLAYRVVGKPAGQDPRYDAAIAYWSGTIKVVGVLGVLSMVLQVIAFVVGWL